MKIVLCNNNGENLSNIKGTIEVIIWYRTISYIVASALVVKRGHEINPDFMIGCMICHITWYLHTCNPKDILACQKKDSMFNDFSGDLRVRGEYPELFINIVDSNEIAKFCAISYFLDCAL